MDGPKGLWLLLETVRTSLLGLLWLLVLGLPTRRRGLGWLWLRPTCSGRLGLWLWLKARRAGDLIMGWVEARMPTMAGLTKGETLHSSSSPSRSVADGRAPAIVKCDGI